MVKLLWGPVLILLRTALQNDPAIPEGCDREAAAAQKLAADEYEKALIARNKAEVEATR